jgi:hypothetical protein
MMLRDVAGVMLVKSIFNNGNRGFIVGIVVVVEYSGYSVHEINASSLRLQVCQLRLTRWDRGESETGVSYGVVGHKNWNSLTN